MRGWTTETRRAQTDMIGGSNTAQMNCRTLGYSPTRAHRTIVTDRLRIRTRRTSGMQNLTTVYCGKAGVGKLGQSSSSFLHPSGESTHLGAAGGVYLVSDVARSVPRLGHLWCGCRGMLTYAEKPGGRPAARPYQPSVWYRRRRSPSRPCTCAGAAIDWS